MQNFENKKNIITFVGKFGRMRHFFILMLLFGWAASLDLSANPAQEYNVRSPKYEVRAVWLTTIGGLDWPHTYAHTPRTIERQQQELRDILDRLHQAGINTILLQTRIRGTVIYPSTYEPWDGCLSGTPGKSPGYDALRFAIDECHRRGMELHAWVVTMPVGKWNGLGCRQLRKRFPKDIRRIGQDGYMNPESTATADYLADICGEITRQYDIDGIHLDYIRYPENWRMNVSRSEGRRNITAIVRAIHHRVKTIKPWVKMSCSPVGKHDDLSRYHSHGWNAYTQVCQDAQGWLRDGLMDELFPMMYFRGNQFYPFAIDWNENSYGRIVAPGLGIYLLSPQSADWPLTTITQELHMLRNYNMGYTFFRSRFLTENVKGLYDFTARHFNHWPALVPPMTWLGHQPPIPPDRLTVDSLTGTMTWTAGKDRSGADTLYYNVYSSRDIPIDTGDSRNLMVTRLQTRSLHIRIEPGRHYAVTAMDRYGNESRPVCTYREEKAEDARFTTAQKSKFEVQLLPYDGNILTLPPDINQMDARLVTIETLQGSVVHSQIYKDRRIDVSSVPDGFYTVVAVSGKGHAHRMGYFLLKRQ